MRGRENYRTLHVYLREDNGGGKGTGGGVQRKKIECQRCGVVTFVARDAGRVER